MARKQSEKKTPAPVDGADGKLVRLVLPQHVHQAFRVESAKEGVSMAAMARRLIEEWVSRRR